MTVDPAYHCKRLIAGVQLLAAEPAEQLASLELPSDPTFDIMDAVDSPYSMLVESGALVCLGLSESARRDLASIVSGAIEAARESERSDEPYAKVLLSTGPWAHVRKQARKWLAQYGAMLQCVADDLSNE